MGSGDVAITDKGGSLLQETCSAASAARGEPMLGTAPPESAFLLVQAPGVWGRVALDTVTLPPEVRHEISALSVREGAKVVMIRRPGRPGSSAGRPPGREVFVWGLARSDESGVRWGNWRGIPTPQDFTLTNLAQPSARPVVLVCTNGKRDLCCAVAGRPVAAALESLGQWDVWESSHLGGHRFSPTFAVLPSGHFFGRVGPSEAPRAVRAALSGGLLSPDWDARLLLGYRGRAGRHPLAQVIEAVLAPSFGELTRGPGPSPEPGARSGSVAVESIEGRRGVVHWVRVDPEAVKMSCADSRLKSETRYEVVAVDDLARP